MPFTTLLGADQQPCELVGHGPITAGHAREIATDATLYGWSTTRARGRCSITGAAPTGPRPGWPTTSAPAMSSAGSPSAAAARSTANSTT